MPCLSLAHRKTYLTQVRLPFLRQKLAHLTSQISSLDSPAASKPSSQVELKLQYKVHRLEQKIARLRSRCHLQTPSASASSFSPSEPATLPAETSPVEPTTLLATSTSLPENSPLISATSSSPSVAVPHPDRPQLLLADVSVQIRPHRKPHYFSATITQKATAQTAALTQESVISQKTTISQKSETVIAQKPASENDIQAETSADTPPKPRFFHRHYSRAELINAESHLGGQIFGPIPAGHRREFFHDQAGVWIWYEDWPGSPESLDQLIVRYEVRPSGVYKKLSAGKYVRLDGWELDNFRAAARLYLQIIKQNLYHLA